MSERRARPPLDPRLVREVGPVRRYLALGTGLAVAQTLVTVGLAIVLGGALADAIVARLAPSSLVAPLGWIALLVFARVALTFAQTRFAQHSAGQVVADLQSRVLGAVLATPLRHVQSVAPARATVATVGLESLRPYFTGYLPTLLSASVLTPVVVLMVFVQDPLSALIAVLTLPLIPVFMWLIGRLTEGRSADRLAALERLEAAHHDMLEGLPTLVHARRVGHMGRRIDALSQSYRRTSMTTLRFAFLSALVLEWLTTLCVALIAVTIGLRLLEGQMTLEAGLIVLILAPDIYLPLRQLGAAFHASEDGLAAVDAAFDALAADAGAGGGAGSAVGVATAGGGGGGAEGAVGAAGAEVGATAPRIALRDVSVRARSGFAPWRARGELVPGRVTALVGPSGAGKTTLLHALVGAVSLDEGSIECSTLPASSPAPAASPAAPARPTAAYLEQRPTIFPGTVRRNLLAFLPPEASAPPDARLVEVLERVGLARVLATHAGDGGDPLDLELGPHGAGLSRGEAQRLAVARLLLHPAPLVLADEPTAHLDADTESLVLDALRSRADLGHTVVMVAHRPELIAAADHVIEVSAA
ncbi:thiol reductant ABC exporter subunit CydD [Micrococcales bacterium 31B]|nr:thiol reductant ABC exporter subunit CydD [Micrococcales bacterium 31B]